MDFFEKTDYSFTDIQSLIDNEIEESIHLDFKAADSLCKDDKKKREISKDVSAFANSDGGIIVYGINEANHKAYSFSFVDGDVYTKEWLEQIINSGIQRRIDGIEIFPIRKDGDIKQSVYLVKIPRSNNAPHISIDKRYYKRFNFQSVPMEEFEVRDLFYRKSKSKLIIVGCGLREETKESNSDLVVYTFVAQVHNESRTYESIYKLNIYFGCDSAMVFVNWNVHESTITYSGLATNRLKVSTLGTSPIFEEETIDIARMKITIPRNRNSEFIGSAKLELKLFYPNGVDEHEYEVKNILK